MKEILDNGYIKLIPSDWRFSSAIVGIKRFFDVLNLDGYSFDEEEFTYNPEYLTEDNLAKFIDKWYGTKLKYNKALEILENNDDFDENHIKEVNTLLTQNKILKDIFSAHKFNRINKEEIIALITENKKEFAINLFLNMETMYKKYCNQSSFMKNDVGICRLAGYYEDLQQKSKKISWQFDKTTFCYTDCIEFDFIPFGFSYGINSCFINANYDLNKLFKVNDDMIRNFSDNDNPNMSEIISSITDLIAYDCEIIVNANKGYFESMFLNLSVLKKIDKSKEYINKLGFIKQNNEWVDIKEIAYDSIINSINLDRIICVLFKNMKKEKEKLTMPSPYIKNLIYINLIIKERYDNMEEKIKKVKISAYHVTQNMKNKNQINGFKQKLISAMTYDDKDAVLKILTKLASASNTNLYFIYDVIADYDNNKDLVYAFINALNCDSNNENKKESE